MRAVVFHKTGARIYEGIDPNEFQFVSEALIDPEFPKGVPPHYWKRVGDKIEVMTEEEKLFFDKQNQLNANPYHDPRVISFRFTKEHHREIIRIAQKAVKPYVWQSGIAAFVGTALALLIRCLTT